MSPSSLVGDTWCPPNPGGSEHAPVNTIQATTTTPTSKPAGSSSTDIESAMGFGPSPLENLNAGGFTASKCAAPYSRWGMTTALL